jgi:hypothetical protein
MPLLNYTTTVNTDRTAAQIQTILQRHGARAVLMEYGPDHQVIGLSFKALTAYGEIPIRLPVDVAATFEVLKKQCRGGQIPRRYVTEQQARRITWRILKDWTEAQMALLETEMETEMVKLEQIFLPYVVTESGRSVYEVISGSRFQLAQGREDSL